MATPERGFGKGLDDGSWIARGGWIVDRRPQDRTARGDRNVLAEQNAYERFRLGQVLRIVRLLAAV